MYPEKNYDKADQLDPEIKDNDDFHNKLHKLTNEVISRFFNIRQRVPKRSKFERKLINEQYGPGADVILRSIEEKTGFHITVGSIEEQKRELDGGTYVGN